MTVASRVVFPTPLRPITLMHSPGTSFRSMSSSTTVSAVAGRDAAQFERASH